MKKITAFFFAIAIIAVTSAFASFSQEDEYIRLDEDNFVLKSSVEGTCVQANPTDVCTWILKEGHEPNTDEDFDPAPTEGEGFIYVD